MRKKSGVRAVKMALIRNDCTGHISTMIPSLRRALGQYSRYCKEYKIGLTTNPEQRWRTHRRDGWIDMVLVYSTSSEVYAADAETLLIEHGWQANYMPECWNSIRGGGGKRSGYGRYYIYMLLYY